jgi:PAS domain S-box-containing protein
MQARGVGRIEHEMRRADGTRFWTEQTLTFLRNAAGEEAGWVLVIHDATEAHGLKEDLRRALDMYEAMLSSTPAVLLIVDRDLRVVRANRAFSAVTGLPEETVVGRPLGEVVSLQPKNEAAMRDALETGLVFEATSELDAKGERLWDWSAVPLRHGEGAVWGLLLVAVDATERRDSQRRFVPHPPPA